MWSGKTPDLSNLKVFGCVAYVHTKQGKLELRALKCMVLGYPKGTKGYKLWDFNSNKSIVSRDVIFFRERVLYVKEFGDNRRKKNLIEAPNSKTKVELIKKGKEKVGVDQLETKIEEVLEKNTANGEDQQEDEQLSEDLSNYTLSRDR